jgi:hypothetical protein
MSEVLNFLELDVFSTVSVSFLPLKVHEHEGRPTPGNKTALLPRDQGTYNSGAFFMTLPAKLRVVKPEKIRYVFFSKNILECGEEFVNRQNRASSCNKNLADVFVRSPCAD